MTLRNLSKKIHLVVFERFPFNTCIWICILVQNSSLIPNTSKNSCYLKDMISTSHCSVNTLPKISHTVALAVKEMAMAVRFSTFSHFLRETKYEDWLAKDSPQEPRVLSKQMRSVNENQKRSGKIQEESFVDADIGTGPGPVSSISGPKVNDQHFIFRIVS